MADASPPPGTTPSEPTAAAPASLRVTAAVVLEAGSGALLLLGVVQQLRSTPFEGELEPLGRAAWSLGTLAIAQLLAARGTWKRRVPFAAIGVLASLLAALASSAWVWANIQLGAFAVLQAGAAAFAWLAALASPFAWKALRDAELAR